METTFRISFTSRSMFPNQQGKPSEHEALAIYAAAFNTVVTYANEKGFRVEDVETENVNEDTCRKKIGNFAYGYAHIVRAMTGSAPSPFQFSARIEAFNYRDHSKYGGLMVSVTGESDLVERVNEAVKNMQPLAPSEEGRLKAKFVRGNLGCYGHCKM